MRVFTLRSLTRTPFLIGALFTLLVLFVLPAHADAACTHYASPSGGGNGLSQSSPFQIANFWSVASAGKTLCLLDGVYTGANSMINPPQGLNGPKPAQSQSKQ